MKQKPKNLTEYVLICMLDGEWWTDWDLQTEIKRRWRFYSESSINAQRRAVRDDRLRMKYGLPLHGEIIEKRPLGLQPDGRRGYEYRLVKEKL